MVRIKKEHKKFKKLKKIKPKSNFNKFYNNDVYGILDLPIYKIPEEFIPKNELIFDEEKIGKNTNFNYDLVEKITNINQNCTLFKVDFQKRPSGYKPLSQNLNIKELKTYFPISLCDFYESLILSFQNNSSNENYLDINNNNNHQINENNNIDININNYIKLNDDDNEEDDDIIVLNEKENKNENKNKHKNKEIINIESSDDEIKEITLK